jgi:hypothetical protein
VPAWRSCLALRLFGRGPLQLDPHAERATRLGQDDRRAGPRSAVRAVGPCRARLLFHFVAAGFIEPWIGWFSTQNDVVIRAIGEAAAAYAEGGYFTILDGMFIPRPLPLNPFETISCRVVFAPRVPCCHDCDGDRPLPGMAHSVRVTGPGLMPCWRMKRRTPRRRRPRVSDPTA